MEITNQEEFKQIIKDTALIYFFAKWCGPCKVFAPIFEANAKNNSNITMKKIDIDQFPEIAANYNIMSIPTLIIMKNGEEIDRCVGIPSNLDNWIKENIS